jgi:hypothetical protein
MASQNAVSMNAYVKVQGKVVQSVSSGFIPQLLILTKNTLVPTQTALSFSNSQAVYSFFGNSFFGSQKYSDYTNATAYFNASNKGTKKPSSVLFYRYSDTDIGAFTRGVSLSATGRNSDLSTLKIITSGALTLSFNGSTYTVDDIDLSDDNSFSAMASTIQTAIRAVAGLSTVTCTFDTYSNAFTLAYPYDEDFANTIDYVLNDHLLAYAMKITQINGAILSQGLAAQTPEEIMTSLTNNTQNFLTYICNFDINSDSTYTDVLGLIRWNNAQTYLYLPIFYDTIGGTTSPITNPMQTAIIGDGWGQNSVAPYTFNTALMYIINNNTTVPLPFAVAGTLASYDYNAPNGIILLSATSYSGITPIITKDSDNDLLVNVFGANSYINLNTRANNFQWFEKGNIGGDYGWADTFAGYVWLADQIQVTLATILSTLNSIPYNNLSIINAVIEPIFNKAVKNGVVQTSIPLTDVQKQALIQQAGYDFTSILYLNGFYMPLVKATPEEQGERKLSNINAWYSYAGGPVNIEVNVTTVR